MVQSCRHILAGNAQCGAPALRNQRFCRHHRNLHHYRRSSGLRSQTRAYAPTQTPTQTYDYGTIPVPTPEIYPPLELEFPEDRASIQINLYRIADALARNLMERSTATALMYAMQVCQTNLGKRPLLEAESAPAPSRSRHTESGDSSHSSPAIPAPRIVQRVILTPDGDEIAPPLEILEDNETEPIHHRHCPCLLCAEKHRNWPGEEHHPQCQCGLCEEQETGIREQGSGNREQSTAPSMNCHPERSEAESRDLLFVENGINPGAPHPASGMWDPPTATGLGAPSLAQPRVGSDHPDPCSLIPDPCRPRIARASALLSGSTTTSDPLNRPWSVAEYTFGDAIRRHEAQYAARAAAALAAGIEPPPYQPFVTGLIAPGTPEALEDEQMQQHSNEYWAAHFRRQIAERPDIQKYLEEEESSEPNTETEH